MGKLVLTDTDVSFLSTIATLDSVIFHPEKKAFFAVDNEGSMCVKIVPEKSNEIEVDNIIYLINIRQIANILKRFLSKRKEVPNIVELKVENTRIIFKDNESNITYRFILGNETLVEDFIKFVEKFDSWLDSFESICSFTLTSDKRKELLYALSSYKDGKIGFESRDGKIYVVIFSGSSSLEEKEYFFEMELPTLKNISKEIFVVIEPKFLKYLYDVEYDVEILENEKNVKIIKMQKNNLMYVAVEQFLE